MSNSYTEKYEILKTFKKDVLQTVLIGSNKESEEEVVVINILHKDKVSKILFKSQFPNGLHNLIHLEEEDNDIIVVTEYKEGTPLDSYISYFNTTVKHKINLAYEYMTKIVKYDIFHNSIRKLLIDESQIIIKNDELHFNELLFLEEDFSEPTEFNIIAVKIGNIIEKIVFSNEPTDDKDNDYASKRILEFINKLKNKDHSFNSIQGVYNAFRKIYIYDLFMENELNLGSEKENDIKESPEKNDVEDNLSKEAINSAVIGYNEINYTNTDTDKDKDKDKDTDTDTDSDEINDARDDVMESDIDEAPEENIDANFDDIEANLNRTFDDIEEKIEDTNEIETNLSEIFIGNEDIKDEYQDLPVYKRKRGIKNKNILKIAIGVILIGIILVGIIYSPATNTLNPELKPEAIRSEAYFVYQKVADTYRFTNDSKTYGKDNEIVEILWEIYKGDKRIYEKADRTSLEIKFKNDGEYKVVLNIKDKYGNTDNYSEIINNKKINIDELKKNSGSVEKLDNLSLNYSNASIVKDYKAFRSGNYSLKLGEEGKSNSAKITIDNLDIDKKPIVSMWIASNSKEDVTILVKGYSNNTLQFQKQKSFTPKETNAWEMVQISETANNIDKIEIVLSGFNSPIWIDDIEIGSYK